MVPGSNPSHVGLQATPFRGHAVVKRVEQRRNISRFRSSASFLSEAWGIKSLRGAPDFESGMQGRKLKPRVRAEPEPRRRMRAKGPQPGRAAASAVPMEEPDPVLPVEEAKDEVPMEGPNDEGDFYTKAARAGLQVRRRREVQRRRRGRGPAWRMAQVIASLCPSQMSASLCPRLGPQSVRHGWSAEEGENAGLEGDSIQGLSSHSVEQKSSTQECTLA